MSSWKSTYGVISIHDDIVIYGTCEEDHNTNLINLLNVTQLEGLVLKSKKLELKRARVSFFWAEYSTDSMYPCLKKIQGITKMTPPIDKQQLASFIGMVTCMGNFVPHLSHHTELLRATLKQDSVFHWDQMANDSFQKIKDLIAKTASQPLRYYDRTKPVVVQTDASQRGLGACLLQDGQPNAFASKSLTDTETRFTNIERELLAIVLTCSTCTSSEGHLLWSQHNISFQDHYEQHPPKVKYLLKTVPKLVIRCITDTAYDSYISETFVPLKSVIKPKKQTRFAGDLVTSVKTIPRRRTRPHLPKWTINIGDLDLLIPIELSQARADLNLNQDLRGDLSVVSPRESHHTKETLPRVPLGQFQAQRSDNITINSIAHSDTHTSSQSEIFYDHNNSSTINKNIVTFRTSTSSQREIFFEQG